MLNWLRRFYRRHLYHSEAEHSRRCRRRGDELLVDIAKGRSLNGHEVFGIRGYPDCAPHFTDDQWQVIWSAWCAQREVQLGPDGVLRAYREAAYG